jgi:hypothetical protein
MFKSGFSDCQSNDTEISQIITVEGGFLDFERNLGLTFFPDGIRSKDTSSPFGQAHGLG